MSPLLATVPETPSACKKRAPFFTLPFNIFILVGETRFSFLSIYPAYLSGAIYLVPRTVGICPVSPCSLYYIFLHDPRLWTEDLSEVWRTLRGPARRPYFRPAGERSETESQFLCVAVTNHTRNPRCYRNQSHAYSLYSGSFIVEPAETLQIGLRPWIQLVGCQNTSGLNRVGLSLTPLGG